MKLLLFTDTFGDANGVSRFLQDIASRAHNDKVDLTIVTSTLKNFGDQNLPNVINVKPTLKIKMPFYPELDLTFPSAKKLKKIFQEIDPDVVHVSTPGYIGLMGRNLAVKYKKPLAGVYHTNFPAYMKDNIPPFIPAYKSTLRFMRFFYRPFSLVFSRSEEYLKHLEQDVFVKNEALCHLLAGIDIDTFKPTEQKEMFDDSPDIANAHIKALYVGRLTKEKNFPFLIEAWKKFAQKMESKGKKAVLVCAGEGDALKYKETLTLHNIYLLGRKSKQELAPLYGACDFFVFPSTTDTLGQVVMESLACATPVIVSDIGGPRSIVERADGTCGLVISPKSSDNWVRAMEILANDSMERKAMGQVGHKMMQNLSIQKSFEAYIKEHSKLIGYN